MKSFDRILEDCLEQLRTGEAIEDCLHLYPRYTDELRPLLQAALKVAQGTAVRPSEEFKQRNREQLMAYVHAHPQNWNNGRVAPSALNIRSRVQPWGLKPVWLAIIIIIIIGLAFFSAGTVMAQSALPGQPLYTWKLVSEQAWQSVSPDPVTTNLALAQRRIEEAVSVSGTQRAIALQGYETVLAHLKKQSNDNPSSINHMVPILTNQRKTLAKAGISVPKLDEFLRPHLPDSGGQRSKGAGLDTQPTSTSFDESLATPTSTLTPPQAPILNPSPTPASNPGDQYSKGVGNDSKPTSIFHEATIPTTVPAPAFHPTSMAATDCAQFTLGSFSLRYDSNIPVLTISLRVSAGQNTAYITSLILDWGRYDAANTGLSVKSIQIGGGDVLTTRFTNTSSSPTIWTTPNGNNTNNDIAAGGNAIVIQFSYAGTHPILVSASAFGISVTLSNGCPVLERAAATAAPSLSPIHTPGGN